MSANHFAPNIKTCDECNKEPKNKILWMDGHRYLWCTSCWPYALTPVKRAFIMSRCCVCNERFKEGETMQAFLHRYDDRKSDWSAPTQIDKEYQLRWARKQDDIKRRHCRKIDDQKVKHTGFDRYAIAAS